MFKSLCIWTKENDLQRKMWKEQHTLFFFREYGRDGYRKAHFNSNQKKKILVELMKN